MAGRGSWVLPVVLALAVVLAGCSSSRAPSAAVAGPTKGSADAGGANGTLGTGTIRGTVTDEEQVPIPGAQVGIVKIGVEVITTDGGSFEFTNVAAGTYLVAAQKIGFRTETRTVQLGADELKAVDFQLREEVLVVPFPESSHHVVVHHYGQAHVDWAVAQAGQTGGCESCDWTFQTDGVPQAILIEIQGKHTVANPVLGDSEYVYLHDIPGERIIRHRNYELPARINYTAQEIGNTTQEFRVQSFCNIDWVCSEERREVWVTAFHHMDVPDGFTAFPPA